MKVSKLKPNPANPRVVKSEKFDKLVKSIQDFPEMMEKRPMVCVTDKDGKIFPLGGNMRLRAIEKIGMKEIPDKWVMLADDWTEEKRKEFTIKDNANFGEWNWDELANNWDNEKLAEWGVDVPNFTGLTDEEMSNFFKQDDSATKEGMQKIILEYTDEDFAQITEAFKKHSGSKEDIVFKLLCE